MADSAVRLQRLGKQFNRKVAEIVFILLTHRRMILPSFTLVLIIRMKAEENVKEQFVNAIVLKRMMKDLERSQDPTKQVLWAANEMASLIRDGDSVVKLRIAWAGLALVHKAQHEIAAAFETGQKDLTDVEERALYTLKQKKIGEDELHSVGKDFIHSCSIAVLIVQHCKCHVCTTGPTWYTWHSNDPEVAVLQGGSDQFLVIVGKEDELQVSSGDIQREVTESQEYMASRLSGEDIIVSPSMQAILNKLEDPLLSDFGSMWGIEKELLELHRTAERIKAVLEVVENKQRNDGLLKLSLKDLRGEAYYTDDMLDEFLYESLKLQDERFRGKKRKQVPSFLSFSLNENQLLRQCDIARITAEISEKLAIIEKKLEKHYFQGPAEQRQHEMLTRLQSFPPRETKAVVGSIVDENHVFGRQEDVQIVKNMLISDQNYGTDCVSVVAIVAMAGIGKTTLAQLVYNDLDITNCFEVRAWVCVSDPLDIERVTRGILNSATRKRSSHLENLEPLQRELENTLRGKKTLIVMDDLWNENFRDWDKLRVPFKVAGEGSKVLVTTRSAKVSSVMNATATHFLRGLRDEDCWSLFKDHAFSDLDSIAYPNLEAIGRKILKKCNGLPLAINTLGGLLQGKLDENEWVFILESEMWDIEEDDVLPALSLSYHHLPPHLKQCFSYCSLFPKDYIFEKHYLVQLWMAEGFIQSKQVERMEDIGEKYFEDLLHRSFFQPRFKDTFVMHDLMHDLACSVSMGICFKFNNKRTYDIHEKVRHISLPHFRIDLLETRSHKFKSSSTFICGKTRMQGNDFPDSFFIELSCLRVLVLDVSGIKSLPNSIGNLKHLRFFLISSGTIETLPDSICVLYNLQVLDIVGCKNLVELPKDLSSLINLQHLLMKEKWWGVGSRPDKIGKLTHLKTIAFFNVGPNAADSIRELRELVNLKGILKIQNLEYVRDIREAEDANLKNKQKIDGLSLHWGYSSDNPYYGSWEDILLWSKHWDDVLENLKPHKGLKILEVVNFPGLHYPTWMTTYILRYNKLVSVLLNGVESKSLPSLGQLPCLEVLKIQSSHKIRQLSVEFYGGIAGSKGFQRLKNLEFFDMDGLEEWCEAEDGEFPSLQYFCLIKCPNVKRLPRLHPTAEELILEIQSCCSLTSLHCGQHTSLTELNVSYCDGIGSFTKELRKFPSLQMMNILYCSTLDVLFMDEFLPPKLKTLSLWGIQQLKSLAEAEAPPMLEDLKIYFCDNLKSLPNGWQKCTSLKALKIEYCSQLEFLFSDGVEEEECYLPALEDIELSGLHQLRSLPKGLHRCTYLEMLSIQDCPQLEMLFSDWEEEEEEECLLPVLETIHLKELNGLRSLPKGLHKFSSLKELYIDDCENLTSLPEDGLPASLEHLKITRCNAELTERCQQGGEDWPKISHITLVEINENIYNSGSMYIFDNDSMSDSE
ncbi:putative disease resistance protein RGA3 [Telopea speciosissima]|uniref:putative disease resistance protein RGA3 n=1 Tax=Telopea speciosissima TaxID=54955 RepID=UPI001CC3602C|nr:putative disease resistance protein RGA3 [Telopea speciosissima]